MDPIPAQNEPTAPAKPAAATPAQSETRAASSSLRRKLAPFVRDYLRPFVFVALILCTFRSSIADWNDVPSGSMNPSILEGDRIFVNKLAYDLKVPFTTWHVAEWGQPKRGDVVVFYSPEDEVRLVKRVVGLPGDVIELKDNRLYVNDVAADYGPIDPRFVTAMAGHPGGAGSVLNTEKLGGVSHPVMELPQVYSPRRSYGPVTVPDGHFFMMGDNRDNSKDSRYIGFVERSRIVGRASAVAMSFDPDHSYFPRWHRFFTSMP